MPTGDLLGVGLSGTLATQRELANTSHNIANANTEGYSRQRVEKSTRAPQHLSNGAIGTGVRVTGVSRIHDEFLTTNVRDNSSLNSSFKTGFELTSHVDDLLSDPRAGLGPILQQFFDAVTGVANEPTSTSARQVMISQAKSLANRFQDLDGRLQELRLSANKESRILVEDINNISIAISRLNNDITIAQQSTGQPANDLLDRRDLLLQQLSEKINVRTMQQDNGAINVFVGNGQTLVLGINPSTLTIEPSEHDPTQIEILFEGKGSRSNITSFVSGGELGGIVDFQHKIINASQNELGRIALALATTFNAQHESGLDLNNRFGKKFFSGLNDVLPQVVSGTKNRGDYEFSARITDITKITTSDYRLDYDAGQFTLVRLSDSATIGKYSSFPQSISEEGFEIKLEKSGSVVDGDSFVIRPTRLAAKSLEVLVTDTNEIAAAAPFRARTPVSNIGNGKIELEYIDINDSLSEQKSLAVGANKLDQLDTNPDATKLRFNIDNIKNDAVNGKSNITIKILENNQLQILDSSAVESSDESSLKLLSAAMKYNPDSDIILTPMVDGKAISIQAKIQGELMPGDTFVIEFNQDAVGDNSNMLSLANLHRSNNIIDGRANYNQAYAQMVSRVGSRTHELDINAEAQQVLLNQSIQAREAVSGVNMDEEAANLVRLQTQFQANAQVIGVANSMFDVLMSMFRR